MLICWDYWGILLRCPVIASRMETSFLSHFPFKVESSPQAFDHAGI